MREERIVPVCSLDIETEPSVTVWAGGSGDLEPRCVGDCVRETLCVLDAGWAWELHQYLANSGRGALLYRLHGDQREQLAVSYGDFEAPFGRGVMLRATVSSGRRIQLGVSVLTAFLVSVSQGSDPCAIDMAGIGQEIRSLGLPTQ